MKEEALELRLQGSLLDTGESGEHHLDSESRSGEGRIQSAISLPALKQVMQDKLI